MTQQPQKMQGKFYPLTTEEIIELSSVLTDTELKILFYLKSVNPFADSFKELDTAVIAEHLGVTRRTAQRAVKKFGQLGLIRLEVTRFKYSINELKSDPRIAKRQQDRQSDSRIAEATAGSPKRQQDRDRSLEPSQGNAFESLRLINTINTSHTPEEPEEREKNLKTEIEENLTNGEEINLKQLDTDTNNEIRTEKGDKKNLGEEKSSAPISPKKKSSQIVKADGFDWLPPGPWLVEGKLDPNFREAIAQDWVNRWGGTIHQRRADVLSHLKKDPANLVIRWEQYSSEWLHRYENTQTLMQNGIEIEPDYQQRLIENQRAVTVPLTEDLNPLADTPPIVKAQVKACSFAVPRGIASTPDSPQETIPKDCENAQAYQHWQPTPEPAQQADYKAFISNWLQSRKMPKADPLLAKIERLTNALRDPQLHADVLREIAQSDRLTCLFDREGNPYQVVEVGQ